MSSDFLKEMFDVLVKKEAPIISKFRRKIQKETGNPASKRKKLRQKTNKSELLKSLGNDEIEFTQYGNGGLRLDFGKDVPEAARKKALNWAQKRGLRISEMSLGKSSSSAGWVLLLPIS